MATAALKSELLKKTLATLQAPVAEGASAPVIQITPPEAKEIILFVAEATKPENIEAMAPEARERLASKTQLVIDALFKTDERPEILRFDARWNGGKWAGCWFEPVRLALVTLRARLRGERDEVSADDFFGN